MREYIVFCGYAGLSGCIKLIKRYYGELGNYFNENYLKGLINHVKENGYYGRYLSPVYNERDYLKPVDINTIFTGFSDEIIPVGAGGILAGLYNMAKCRKCGFEIEIKKINTIQICIEICEYYGLNIYRLLSEGMLILSEDPYKDLDILRENNISSELIGRLTKGLDKIIIDKEVPEYVNRPGQDEIFKVV